MSIIIPAYNASATISLAINACLNQEYSGDVEIIVVDDGSSDNTADCVRAFPQVRYFHQPNAGPASARNLGAAQARGEWIFLTDADCVPRPDWLKKLSAHFSDPAVAAVMGSYGIANPESLLARCISREILFRHGRMPLYPKAFGSYNVAVRAAVFRRLGGFNASYRRASGEDNDLSYRILAAGYKIYFAKEAVVAHHHPSRVCRYLSEQYRHGIWRVKMYRAHPAMMKGDDYTFWKDPAEILLVFASAGLLILGLFSAPALLFMAAVLYLLLILINMIYTKIFIKKNFECLFFAGVLSLRAGARAAGFVRGIFFRKSFAEISQPQNS